MRTKKVSNKAMLGELRSLAMISGGMILGTMGGKAIDKQTDRRSIAKHSKT